MSTQLKTQQLQQDQQQLQQQKKTKAYALTINELRSYPGLENLSDMEAKEVIKSLEAFAQLTFSHYTNTYG